MFIHSLMPNSLKYLSRSFSAPMSPLLTILVSPTFSSAARTLSLSLSCLLMSYSVSCLPFSIKTSILYRGGRQRCSFTRIIRPIKVAIEQFGMVGVNSTRMLLPLRVINSGLITRNFSRVRGCSGSLMWRSMSKIS